MTNDIRVILIRPGENPEVTSISNRLDAFQGAVGGYLEMVWIDREKSLAMLVNEDGIRLELEPNTSATQIVTGLRGPILGPAIILRVGPGGDNQPVQDEDIERFVGAVP